MPQPTELRSIVASYVQMMCDTNIDGLMQLFDDAATVEDPVGGEILSGIDAVRAFYTAAAAMLQVELAGPVCVAGLQCAFPVRAQLTVDQSVSYLDAIDVFEFTEDGKIQSMRAYWNPQELRPTP